MLDVVLKLLVQGIGLGLLDDGEFGLGRELGRGEGMAGEVDLDEVGVNLSQCKPPLAPHVMPANLLQDLPKNAAWN